jgi:hypothetical protein
MKLPVHRIPVFFLFLLATCHATAQDAVLPACGNLSGNNSSVSYSVGQMAYITQTGSGGIITEGVQQPFEIIYVPGPGIGENGSIPFECLLYPNPANDHLTLKVISQEKLNLKYQLAGINGKTLRDDRLENRETNIPVADLPPGTYILTVTGNKTAIKTIKIIKK